jgi:hypothetical protein
LEGVALQLVAGVFLPADRRYIDSSRAWRKRSEEILVSGFDTRKTGEEAKFALDQELRFKANARRNKLLGLWAADLLGLTGEAASAYAVEVVKADFEAPGDEDVFRKVRGDFDKAGIAQTDHQLHRQMEELLVTAIEQVKSEKK